MEKIGKSEIRELVNCYFLCKIIEGENFEFIGFNHEKLDITQWDLKSMKFENNQIYLIENLEKEGNRVVFIKGQSSISKNDVETSITDFSNYNSNIPYSLTGKIIKKEKDQILLLLSSILKIIIISNIGNKFINIDENRYVKISNIKYSNKVDSTIYFKMTDLSLLNLLADNYQEEKIKEKVAIKLNLLDFEEGLKEENILLSHFEIESPKNYMISYDSYRKIIYYIYDASNYNKNDYYVQNINLFFKDELNSFQMKFFVYKSLLNEANLFIKQKCLYTYEFMFFSIDNSLPKEIEIFSNPGQKNKYDNFHTFNSKIRKSIIFINIPSQDNVDKKHDNNFLKIFLCKREKIEVYGTFLLKSIEYKKKTLYKYEPIIERNILNIYNDFLQITETEDNAIKFHKKYLSFDENITKILEDKMNEDLRKYYFEDNEKTIKYYHSLCLWSLLNIIKKNKLSSSCVDEYISLYKKIVSKKDLNNIDKIKILITYTQITLEVQKDLVFPKFFFYEELKKKNPYRVAYEFQFKIIENINEESCLFQPLLFLDSYIMDNLYSKEFKFVKSKKPAYSISMLTLDSIKEHLKKSIKNYFFVIEKTNKLNKRDYNASIYKFSKIVTYNENILLFENPKYNRMYDSNDILFFNNKFVKTYTLTLNLENMHENFSHGKETIINIKDSPTLYFTRDFKFSYIHNHESPNKGEAGRLLEAFIGEESDIEEMKKSKYDMSDYFDVIYFTDKDFTKLNEGFKNAKSNNNKVIDMDEINQINIEYCVNNQLTCTNFDASNKLSIRQNDLIKENIKSNENNYLAASKSNNESNKGDGDGDEIILSKYNTYTLTADNYEELMEKIEQLKKKKFIVRKDAIKCKNKNCWY